jgi:predicted flavoprotein YhiN
LKAVHFILAFGGASWPKTGSDGNWKKLFEHAGILTEPFQPSNCGIEIIWPETISQYHIGKPLKNISISIGNMDSRGEAMITADGLEGYAIYPVVPEIRKLQANKQELYLFLDLKPFNTLEQLKGKADSIKGKKPDIGQLFNLGKAELALLKAFTSKNEYLDSSRLVGKIKKLPIPVAGLRPIEEAISTAGGVQTTGLNPDFSLKDSPWIHTIGEMVAWDAPTGGYLLQACYSMARHTAHSIIRQKEKK